MIKLKEFWEKCDCTICFKDHKVITFEVMLANQDREVIGFDCDYPDYGIIVELEEEDD